jgi:hypothetical protein
LRNDEERTQAPDPVPNIHLCLMSKVQAKSPLPHADLLVEHDHGVQFLRELYVGLLAHAAAEIGTLFTTLSEPEAMPAVFHCAVGKDRTGVVAAIFALIGLLQLARAALGWEVTLNGLTIPIWASWIAAAVGLVNKTGVVIILLTVIILHVLTMNVLYPKIVGKRLRLNPLAISLSLLFWAWIWGGMGLILAVPLVGATKIICDYVEPLRGLGAWLGD